MNKFRPQEVSKKYRLKQRIQSGIVNNYNWQSRVRWYPAGWKINHQTLGRIFRQLHYLGSHAPKPIQARWRRQENLFLKAHIPVKASIRYIEKFSAGRWL
jgi:hypothetical protein